MDTRKKNNKENVESRQKDRKTQFEIANELGVEYGPNGTIFKRRQEQNSPNEDDTYYDKENSTRNKFDHK